MRGLLAILAICLSGVADAAPVHGSAGTLVLGESFYKKVLRSEAAKRIGKLGRRVVTSDAFPVAVVGGAVVAAGGGTVYVLRKRRKAKTETTATGEGGEKAKDASSSVAESVGSGEPKSSIDLDRAYQGLVTLSPHHKLEGVDASFELNLSKHLNDGDANALRQLDLVQLLERHQLLKGRDSTPMVTLACRRALRPGTMAPLEVWLHAASASEDVRRRIDSTTEAAASGTLASQSLAPVADGAALRFHLSAPGLSVPEPWKVLPWNGAEIGRVCFDVTAPPDARAAYDAEVKVFLGGLRLAHVHFVLDVVTLAEVEPTQPRLVKPNWTRRAYASAAALDRPSAEVWARSVRHLAPYVDIKLSPYIDSLAVEDPDRLARDLSESDVFCLFWSKAAAGSPVVATEWRTALKLKGVDWIEPVRLEGLVPLPPELQVQDEGSGTDAPPPPPPAGPLPGPA